jgi:hypothetical protein
MASAIIYSAVCIVFFHLMDRSCKKGEKRVSDNKMAAVAVNLN